MYIRTDISATPQIQQLAPPANSLTTSKLYDYRKPNRLLAGAVREAGIPLLDMTDDFAEHYQRNPHDKRYYPIDRHFNKKGHELVTDLLTRFLTEQGFVD